MEPTVRRGSRQGMTRCVMRATPSAGQANPGPPWACCRAPWAAEVAGKSAAEQMADTADDYTEFNPDYPVRLDGKVSPNKAKSTRVYSKISGKWMLVHANFSPVD